MCNRLPRRGIRAAALAFLTLATLFTVAGCGKDGGGITDPIPSDPDPTDPGPGPGPQPGPAPVGDVAYAVDLANNFLVFGTGSLDKLTLKTKITGLPFLKRIIGLAFRPSDGKLIGVGNDSRVYTIDPQTAEATPIGNDPFSPMIASFFDIHFAMAVEPSGQRIRLIAAESGGNWSIDMTDGSARLDPNAKYAPGTPLAGRTPRLLGIVHPTLPDSAKQAGWCANLAYAVDADEAIMLASCDPASGLWFPTGMSPEPSASSRMTGRLLQASVAGSAPKAFEDLKDQLMRCGEFMPSPLGSESDGEKAPPDDGYPWFPHSPDTEFYVFLVKLGEAQARPEVQKTMLITPEQVGLVPVGTLGTVEPVQSVVWEEGGLYGPTPKPKSVRQVLQQELSLAAAEQPQPVYDPAPSSDPRAHCGS
jgi:hypothetical protein